jgi:hypothetical protein
MTCLLQRKSENVSQLTTTRKVQWQFIDSRSSCSTRTGTTQYRYSLAVTPVENDRFEICQRFILVNEACKYRISVCLNEQTFSFS